MDLTKPYNRAQIKERREYDEKVNQYSRINLTKPYNRAQIEQRREYNEKV